MLLVLGTGGPSKGCAIDEKRVHAAASAMFRTLFCDLPTEVADHGRIAVLPPAKFPLPRAKPPPVKKAETSRWSEYAASRGIKRRRRENKTFDADIGEFVPRHGKKRRMIEAAKQSSWVVEVPSGKKFAKGEDPFTERAAGKRAAQSGQTTRQRRNTRRAGNGLATASFGAFDAPAGGVRTRRSAVAGGSKAKMGARAVRAAGKARKRRA